jgi:glycosyltransferase involved in cell wall biosynthesis
LAAPSTAADPASPPPLFSVLLPSHNRLELLKHAIASVQRQGFDDVEIVVADNASDDDYRGYVDTLAEPRLRYLRADKPAPVTENWNRALQAARGRYMIVIGDDDALSPGYLARAAELVERFPDADAICAPTYYYAYPRIFATAPAGFLAMINPLPLPSPLAHVLDPDEQSRCAAGALKLRHRFAFNSQYFIWRRTFIDRLAGHGPFFQSPFPDFYAAFMTLHEARGIVISPDPGVIIGASPQSYSYHLHSDDLGAADERLMLREGFDDAVRALSPAITRALARPGSSYFRNWLIAALTAARNLGLDLERAIDCRRYRRIQLFDHAYRIGFQRRHDLQAPDDLDPIERRLFDHLTWMLATMRRARTFNGDSTRESLLSMYRIYRNAVVTHYALSEHQNITDAWNWLAFSNSGSTVLPFLHVDPAGQPVDVFQLEKMMGDMGSALSAKDLHIGKLDVLIRGKDAQISALTDMVRTRERVFASPGRLLYRSLLLMARNLRRTFTARP